MAQCLSTWPLQQCLLMRGCTREVAGCWGAASAASALGCVYAASASSLGHSVSRSSATWLAPAGSTCTHAPQVAAAHQLQQLLPRTRASGRSGSIPACGLDNSRARSAQWMHTCMQASGSQGGAPTLQSWQPRQPGQPRAAPASAPGLRPARPCQPASAPRLRQPRGRWPATRCRERWAHRAPQPGR